LGSIVSWSALVAWFVALVCAALGWRKRGSLERLLPGVPERLLAELTTDSRKSEELGDRERRMAIAELNLRLADVSFELDVLPATFAALTRITLASGVALAVICALTTHSEGPLTRAFRIGLAAGGGFAGALAVAGIGRVAKGRSAQIREEWDGASRVVGKALGTSLAAAGRIRGNSFPE
jgi:hypothetical protein